MKREIKSIPPGDYNLVVDSVHEFVEGGNTRYWLTTKIVGGDYTGTEFVKEIREIGDNTEYNRCEN